MSVSFSDDTWVKTAYRSSCVTDSCHIQPLIHILEFPTLCKQFLTIHIYVNRGSLHSVLVYGASHVLMELDCSLKYIVAENIVMFLKCSVIKVTDRCL